MDERVTALMAAQDGVLGARQAVAAGASWDDLTRWCRRGLLTRVRRGALVDGRRYADASTDERFRLRVCAVLIAHDGFAAASHHSALAVYGLPLYQVDTGRIDLVGDVATETIHRGLCIHPRLGLTVQPVSPFGSLAAVTVPRALVQTASRSGVTAGVVAADAALARGLCGVADIEDELAHPPHVRGRRRVASMLELVDLRCESVGESRTRLVLAAAGLPIRTQVTVRDRGGVLARVDFLVGERVVVEFDGAVKYAGDSSGRSLFAEKRREDRLRELGFEVVRVTWADLARPDLVIQRVRAAMARGAARSHRG